jgi:Uma2 family endonuclease
MPLDALEDSDPEPDAAVVSGPVEQYHDHPHSALLVVEVADTSMRLDRRKASIYAAAKVQEYWIVNLNARCIEIYRKPVADSSTPLGFVYPPPTVANENDVISPLAFAGKTVKVGEFLP